MNAKIEERIKKSNLNANNKFDYEKLIHSAEGLLPCTYVEELEEIIFTYDSSNMKNVQQITEESKENQYQFLMNFPRLYQLAQTYRIPITTENLFYSESYIPAVKTRDVHPSGMTMDIQEFMFIYKAFIGGILAKAYSVQQIQESGLEVLKKETSIKELIEADNINDIIEILRTQKNNYLTRQKAATTRVAKGPNVVKTAIAIVSTLLLIAVASLYIYQMVAVKPVMESVVAANQAYISRDYVGCIDSLKDLEPEDMEAATKYILAISYAKSESFNEEKLENIVAKLSVSSNEKELNYWIYLGRREYSQASDIAKALSDDQLLMYAYMKELDQLESDTQTKGEDKESRMTTLEGNINKLGEKYTPDEEDEGSTVNSEEEGTEEETKEDTKEENNKSENDEEQ